MAERILRKLRAILSADAVGYSRLMGDNEVATVRTLEAHREVITDTVSRYRGRVVDSPGDNLLAEFSSVVDALEAAVEIQKRLENRNNTLPEDRKMAFRIGINLGDVIQAGDRIYGDGVNIAARVERLARGGGICITESAYQQVKNKLVFSYEAMGAHTVKNITDPVRVYRIRPEPGRPASRTVKKPADADGAWKKKTLAVLAAVLVAAWGLRAWRHYVENRLIAPPANTIAVLPFDNITGNPGQAYLADGLSEAIITALSQRSELSVPARASTFQYKKTPVDVIQIGRKLKVRHVLEGSIQRSGDRIRVTAQLINTKTGRHIWSGRYDRDLEDLLDVQDEICEKIVSAVREQLMKEKEKTGKSK